MQLIQGPPYLEFISECCGCRWKILLLYFTHSLLSVIVKFAKMWFFFSDLFVLRTIVLYLSAFQVPSIETRGAVSPAVLMEQKSSWIFPIHMNDASSNSS